MRACRITPAAHPEAPPINPLSGQATRAVGADQQSRPAPMLADFLALVRSFISEAWLAVPSACALIAAWRRTGQGGGSGCLVSRFEGAWGLEGARGVGDGLGLRWGISSCQGGCVSSVLEWLISTEGYAARGFGLPIRPAPRIPRTWRCGGRLESWQNPTFHAQLEMLNFAPPQPANAEMKEKKATKKRGVFSTATSTWALLISSVNGD